jgi:DNA-binding transcriptional LysR family regulator
MDLKQLNAVVAVADTGSVTRAAEILHIVQPAVSRQIHLLEQELGSELFERSRQGMRLTGSGRKLVERARRALAELERARAEIRPVTDELTGLVTVGLLASTAELLAADLVRDVRDRYPGVALRITAGYAGHLREWLEDADVDMALLYGLKPSATMQVTPLIDESLWAVAPVQDGLDPDSPVPFAEAVGHPLVMPSAPHGLRAVVERAAARSQRELTIVTETNAVAVQKRLVQAALGWTILPAVAVADDLARGTLSAAPVSDPELSRRIVLALPRAPRPPDAVRVVADALVERMSAAVAGGAWPSARWLPN